MNKPVGPFWFWIRGSVILNYCSGSGRLINYRSGSYLDIFVTIESAKNSKDLDPDPEFRSTYPDSDPRGQINTVPPYPDPEY
jgi:hypothetical protein